MPTAHDQTYDAAGNLLTDVTRTYDNDPLSPADVLQLRQALKALIAAPRTDPNLVLLARFILNIIYQPYDVPPPPPPDPPPPAALPSEPPDVDDPQGPPLAGDVS